MSDISHLDFEHGQFDYGRVRDIIWHFIDHAPPKMAKTARDNWGKVPTHVNPNDKPGWWQLTVGGVYLGKFHESQLLKPDTE